MAETTPPGRTEYRTDLALAGLVLAFTAASIVLSGIAVWQIVGGIAVTLVQLASLPLRRTRPRTALAVLAVPAAAGFAVQAPSQALLWAVLAFALVRGPLPAGRWLTLAVLVVSVISGAGYVVGTGTVAGGVGYGISIGLQIGLYALVGAVLGVVSRSVRAREEARRRDEEQARTAAAMAVQRTRIAAELGSGVLDGLHSLTARAATLGGRTGRPDQSDTGPPNRVPDAPAGGTDDVVALEREARDVLTRMRRTLATLREQDDPAASEPVAGTAPLRRTAWLPTRRGVALSAAIALVALGVDALPLRPIGQVSVDRSIALLDLPWASPVATVSITVQVLALMWWRSAPATAFTVATVAAIVTGTLGGTNVIVESSWMFLVYAVATGAPPRRSGVLTAVGTLAVLVAYLTVPTMGAEIVADPAGIVLSYLVVPFLWFAGVRRREHRLLAGSLRRERHESERTEALERERLRVARDLHDVVAHHVSAIAVQAGAARITTDPAARREAYGHIADSGLRVAEALPELETLTPDAGGVALTADGVEQLVAPVRAAGVPVSCEVRGEPAAAGDPELFAQRILTEALTNVVRHAGPSDTRVLVEHGTEAVTVRVADSGPAAGHPEYVHGSGLGTAGMLERARMLGGHVDAGPDGDGWRVAAVLPRPVVPTVGLLVREEEEPLSISSPTTTRRAADPA